ncbi:M15 family metallopeptidase [Flammeovirga sp. SubArs3]|uniref:M15 family metallopeptidase n=1 Tax=Flammeovirga sp. SubArs3 TaxID=2995316 RepID=UPI00248D20AC|nr:M15 family metallopeptidase [Flammeovirga sp. SubArs3]
MKAFIKYSTFTIVILVVTIISSYLYAPKWTYVKARTALVWIMTHTVSSQPYATPNGIHPLLEKKLNLLIEKSRKEGINIRLVRGFRDLDTQAKLYAQGRTAPGGIVTNAIPGLSYHNYGWAIDVCPVENGALNWNSKHWNRVGELGEECGLKWGGRWTRLVDKPHFQLKISDIIF